MPRLKCLLNIVANLACSNQREPVSIPYCAVVNKPTEIWGPASGTTATTQHAAWSVLGRCSNALTHTTLKLPENACPSGGDKPAA